MRPIMMLAALLSLNDLSAFCDVSTQIATGPAGKYKMPASVRASLTVPLLCATTTFSGRKRLSFSLSSHFFMWPSISLHTSRLTILPSWTFSSISSVSRAVVEPRPNFLVRAGSSEVLEPRKTLAFRRDFGSPSVQASLVDARPMLIETSWWRCCRRRRS